MCREIESIEKVNRAADNLAEACRNVCRDDLTQSLKAVYDRVLSEGIHPYEQQLLDRLQ